MLLNELLKQDDDKKIVENPKIIEFSSKTVRFGDSLYQLRNVTGFEVGQIPKNKLPLLWIIGLFAVGLAFLIAVVGIIPIGIAIWLIYSHVNQVQKYGFILSLNSGETTYFISSDKNFLGKIVSGLYRLMEGDIESIVVNFQDRTVNVYGKVEGVLSSGDNPEIHQRKSI